MFAVHVKELDDIKTQYTDFVNKLNEHDRIILKNNGKNEAVLINIDDYNEFESFAHKNYIKKKLKETENLVENKNVGWIDEGEFWEND
jgi:PHD/YefM family antitoxin component YafN of YafNO toxin-antitoxin module